MAKNSNSRKTTLEERIKIAIAANPGATPLFHSHRGYPYTSKAFRQKIIEAGMT